MAAKPRTVARPTTVGSIVWPCSSPRLRCCFGALSCVRFREHGRGQRHQHGTAGECLDEADDVPGCAVKHHEAEGRREGAGDRDQRPAPQDPALGPAARALANGQVGPGGRLGQVRDEDRGQERGRDLALQHGDAEHGGLRDPVQGRPEEERPGGATSDGTAPQVVGERPGAQPSGDDLSAPEGEGLLGELECERADQRACSEAEEEGDGSVLGFEPDGGGRADQQ